jgi:predicted permease
LREILAGAEVALAVVLTAGAGLMIRSLWTLQHSDPGFRSDRLATLRFDIPVTGYSDEARRALPERLAERLESLPGVETTAASTADLLIWPGINRGFEVEGHEPYRNQFSVYFQNVTPGFFRTMGIPLIKGRDFTDADNQNSPPVMIVSQAFARRFLPGQDPIGKRLRVGGPQKAWQVIIGVVGDAQMEDVRRTKSDVCFFYSPMRNAEVVDTLSVVVHTAGNPSDLLPELKTAVQRFDANLTIFSVATAQQRITRGAAGTRSFTMLMALFGTIAVGLALLGTYGVIAYSISQRVREVGIRMALGAQRADIVRLVTTQALRFIGAGLLAGAALTVVATPLLTSMLIKVKAHDPVVLCATELLVAIAAIGASFIPARRAANVAVMAALRQE